MLEEMGIFLRGLVRVAVFGPAHADDIGERALKALENNNAAVLANHGVLGCGRTKEHDSRPRSSSRDGEDLLGSLRDWQANDDRAASL